MWGNLRCIRWVSDNVRKKSDLASRIKALNYENKTLFGAVQKKKKAKTTQEKSLPSKESEKSSEIFWMIEHKTKKETTNNDVTLVSTVKKFTKEFIQESGTAGYVPKKGSKIIPFTSKDLNKLLRFPLILGENEINLENEEVINAAQVPSVGKILQATMSDAARKALMKWKINKIIELGEEGFNKLQQEHLRQGKMLHEALQIFLVAKAEPKDDSEILPLWKSVFPALQTLDPSVELTEALVEHPILKYRGVVDCVSKIGSQLSVIEWKKSDKRKNYIEMTYDAPIQLVAYLGALSADPKYRMQIKAGYVVIAYSDGVPADIHQLNDVILRKYWQIWLRRLQEFWIRTRDGTIPEPL